MILFAQALIAVSLVSAASPAQDDGPLIAAAIDAGRFVQAETMLERLPAAQRDDETAILAARLALAQGRAADAYRDFALLAARQPDRCVVIAGLGVSAAQLGDEDQAIPALARATAGCHVDWRVWNALAAACDARGRWSEAGAAFARALELAGPRPLLLNNLGVSLLHQGRFAAAADYFRVAARAAPDDRRIIDNLDIAAASIGIAPVRDPAHEDATRWAARLGNAGNAALRAGRTADARAYLAEAVTVGPVLSADADRALRDLH